tara:strand:+ start:514 stop:819 length:306 start_codon:yes stop_codon:yes gene_type:complete
VDALGDEIVSASLHEVLTVVRQPIDDLMTRLVELGFQPITQGSALLYALSLFVVRYVHHAGEGVDQQTSIKLAQAEVVSHPAISRFLGNQVGEAIDRKVKG